MLFPSPQKYNIVWIVLVLLHRAKFVLNAEQPILEVDAESRNFRYYFSVQGPFAEVFFRPWILQWPFKWFRLPFNPTYLWEVLEDYPGVQNQGTSLTLRHGKFLITSFYVRK
jgi:hypothetical protein